MNGSHLVREARKRAGLTQTELAYRAGTTQSAIARCESGRTAPTLERITDLVRTCGFDVNLALVPFDDHDWSITKAGLDRTPQQRSDQLVAIQHFASQGRAAMAAAKAKRGPR